MQRIQCRYYEVLNREKDAKEQDFLRDEGVEQYAQCILNKSSESLISQSNA
jgi:hypothetical protein